MLLKSLNGTKSGPKLPLTYNHSGSKAEAQTCYVQRVSFPRDAESDVDNLRNIRNGASRFGHLEFRTCEDERSGFQ